VAETLEILKGLKAEYERPHELVVSEGALNTAVQLSERYITGRFFPDKAIDLIDQAASRVRIANLTNDGKAEVTSDHIAEILSELTGIPAHRLSAAEIQQLR